MIARTSRAACALLSVVAFATPALADHQTETFSPVHSGNSQPYSISVQRFDWGTAPRPTLHSFASGHYDGKWVMLAGRTNGLHGFGFDGNPTFPPASQNKEVWVIDPVTKQSWHRTLEGDAGISPAQLAHLSSTNTQYAQVGNRLYVTGGYGNSPDGFQTSNLLSSIDLPSLTNWVVNGTGSAGGSIRSTSNDAFRVTGGAMYEMNGRMHLVFGQNFVGEYPGGSTEYTFEVRSFDIVDDGTNLSIANYAGTGPNSDHRRRDLNVFPTLKRKNDNSLGRGLEALSGVFTGTDGVWTVPVKIDENGQPSMADPKAPGTFKQAMNNYHSAKLGMYSATRDSMHEVLFGGITVHRYDSVAHTIVRDDTLPFTNQISQVNIDSSGNYTQDYLGEFPALFDPNNNRLRFGANAEFFPAAGVPMFDNGVINIDAITGPTVLGYIYGGIFANAPNVFGVPGAVSGGSNEIFTVMYAPVPEPGALSAVVALGLLCVRRRCRN